MAAISAAFQSTHPRGVRRTTSNGQERRSSFQSTHPRGVRLRRPHRLHGRHQISIHAPARGATPTPAAASPSMWHFNPRTREGCDLASTSLAWFASTFQSTHPRGVRLKAAQENGISDEFQSTHPRGVRRWEIGGNIYDDKFQSTHPRGVRPIENADYIGPDKGFQSTHPRGVRLRPRRAARSGLTYFNPRTREGCDVTQTAPRPRSLQFQSTHPRGVRQEFEG